MTENHGVPGLNPGPVIQESYANSKKPKSLGTDTEALCQQRASRESGNRAAAGSSVAAVGVTAGGIRRQHRIFGGGVLGLLIG